MWDRKDYCPATVHPPAPLVPLDGTVLAPAVPGHLPGGPLIPAPAPVRAVAGPTRPELEEPR